MLRIQPINFFKNSNYVTKNVNYNTPKISLLTRDTVSFTGERQLTDIREIVKNSDANFEEIEKNASVAENKLKKSLNKAFASLVFSSENPKGILEPISVRVKGADSIEEKVISILADAVKKADASMLFKIENSQSIKEHVDDVIGARLILKESNPRDNTEIIDRLIELVRNGELKIKKIEEIKLPDKEGISPYFDKGDLQRLEDEVNKKRNQNNKIKIVPKESKTGYCALHLDLDLSNKNAKTIYDGYSGEIQIMGYDVAQLKEVEDLCYKVKQDKSINGRHPAYDAFINHLNKYFKNEDKKLAEKYKEDFEEYTYKAYLIQRKKKQNAKDYNPNVLPSLKDCGMDKKLDPELDFNYLRKIKENCDKIYDLSKKSKTEQEDISSIVTYSSMFYDMLKKIQNPTVRSQILKPLSDLHQLTSK